MDNSVLSAIVDIVIALLSFGGGIIAVIVTQKHLDKRHSEDVGLQKTEDTDKHIDDIEKKCFDEINKAKSESEVALKNLITQMDEMKDLFGDMRALFQQSQAITEIKIERLTDECRKHNGVIERTFKLEAKADLQEEQIKVANHRIEDAEKQIDELRKTKEK